MKCIYTFGRQAKTQVTAFDPAERLKALGCYSTAIMDGSFPDAATSVSVPAGELSALRERSDRLKATHT